jgi:hypothetical protein
MKLSGEIPLTLYLDLAQGEKPDVATAARAMLAFEDAVKEIMYVLDPGAVLRVEFDSGTEGSLKLNTIIRSLQKRGLDKKSILALIFSVVLWLASSTGDYIYHKILDNLVAEQSATVTDQEFTSAIIDARQIQKNGIGEKQVRQIFREIQGDKSIIGIGVSTSKASKPISVTPRSEFEERAKEEIEVSTDVRTKTEPKTVLLVSPVLVPSERKWRVKLDKDEFGVIIKDEKFLKDFLSGSLKIPMRSGIVLDVLLETREEKIDGVWKIKNRTVLSVTGYRNPPENLDLFE